jgi:hypothetical protein
VRGKIVMLLYLEENLSFIQKIIFLGKEKKSLKKIFKLDS